jgi:hypothetical protein
MALLMVDHLMDLTDHMALLIMEDHLMDLMDLQLL